MAGRIYGSGVTIGTTTPFQRTDRWLNFRIAFPPERNIRDREDSPGSANPHNLWISGSIVGGEETGMQPFIASVFDDDIKFSGTKAFSYQVRGQCLDSTGAAVPGATVELWLTYPTWDGANEPRLSGTTTSDASGLVQYVR